jgi:hypothetical protein
MVPTLVTFVTVLTVLVVMDAMAGGVDAARLLAHGLVVLGLVLVIVLDRLPGPAGGTVPGVSPRRQPRSTPCQPADRAITPTTPTIHTLPPTAHHRRIA